MVDMGGSSGNSLYTGTVTIKSMSSVNAVIDGGSTKCVMYVNMSGSGAEIVLNYITIENGSADTAGGVYVKAGKVVVGSGTAVTGNIKTNSSVGAGGIYVSSGSTLYMADGCSVTGNYSAGSIGGIYVASGADFYSGTSGTTAITGVNAILDNVSGNKVGCTISGTTVSGYTGVCDVLRLSSTAADSYVRISAPDGTKNQGGIAGACTALAAGGNVYLNKTTDTTADVTWNVTGTVSIANTGDLAIQATAAKKALITGSGLSSASVLACTNTGALTLTELGITGGSASYGGGINKSGAGTLELTNCSVYGNTATQWGGGIYVDTSGNVTLTDTIVGTEVTVTKGTQVTEGDVATYSNKANHGGGMYIKNSTVHLAGSTKIANNWALDGNAGTGGGIVVYGTSSLYIGTANDHAPQIYANRAHAYGGVSTNEGSTTYIYGSIHHNYAGIDGGVYNQGSVSMYDGSSIRDNKTTSSTQGAGVDSSKFSSSCTFTMNGGTISNNASEGQHEVNVGYGTTFTMEGSAVVTPTNACNSVYLAKNCVITVGGALTGAAPVAKVTLATPSVGTSVVSLASNLSSPKIAEVSGKFALTDSTYFITKDGTIASTSASTSNGLTYLFTSIPSGEAVTVKLSQAVTITGSSLQIISGQNITLSSDSDYTLTASSASAISVSGGSLTIGGGTGILTITGGAGSANPCIAVTGGTLKIINGATVTTSTTAGTCGISVSSGAFEMSGGTITGSKSRGLTVSGGTVTITGGSITRNGTGSYSYPAVLLSGGSGTISGLSITETQKGCGLEISDGNYSFTGCTITGNANSASSSTDVYGGGIYIQSTTPVSFTNCTVTGNSCTASAAYAYGGGIAIGSGGTVTFTGGAVSSNTATASGNNSGTSGQNVYCASGATYNGSTQTIN